MTYKRIVLLLFLSVYIQIAIAEEEIPQAVSEEDYIGDVPKVLTISRLSQPLSDAPSAVTIIDRATIRASGIVDLPEIFRLVPGMYVAANAGFIQSTDYAVSYHGMTSAYSGSMQVMINGRSVYSPLYGGVKWSELPIAIADIERIEVTRGPNAASYGANSFFGVINIITQHPQEAPSNSVIATHGNGRNEGLYRHAGKLNELNYRVTVGHRDDNGFDNRNDFKRTRFLNAQGDFRIDDKNSLELEFGIADGDREEGEITKDKLLFLPREKDINNHYELIRWRHNINDDSDFSLQAYHSFDRSDDKTTSVNLRPLLGAFGSFLLNDTITVLNPVETERYDIEAQHNFTLGKKLRFVWGGSVRQDGMYAPHYLGTGETDYFNLQRLFGHVEWQANERLVVNAGAMVEHNDFTGTDLSPRGSLNFMLTPQHTIRLGISSALRTPNYLEEKFNRFLILPTVPNAPVNSRPVLFQYAADKGHLDPEKIISREIAYLAQIGRLSFDARLYHDSIFNTIRLMPVPAGVVPPPGFSRVITPPLGFSNGVNIGSATADGFEMQAKLQITSNTNILFNYAGENIRQALPTGFTTPLKKDLENSAPGNTVSALITHQFTDDWDGSFAYYQTSKVEALGDGQPVALIRRADLRLARKFNIGTKNGEISVVVENLFDNDYQEFARYNVAKRLARVNLSLDF
ncbi:MAG: TonB-dependent receptor plug domain-containing protein [Methylophilaceae bacterium]